MTLHKSCYWQPRHAIRKLPDILELFLWDVRNSSQSSWMTTIAHPLRRTQIFPKVNQFKQTEAIQAWVLYVSIDTTLYALCNILSSGNLTYCLASSTTLPIPLELWYHIYDSSLSSAVIWRNRPGLTLTQVMASCLMAPTHYLMSLCWFLIRKLSDFHLREFHWVLKLLFYMMSLTIKRYLPVVIELITGVNITCRKIPNLIIPVTKSSCDALHTFIPSTDFACR